MFPMRLQCYLLEEVTQAECPEYGLTSNLTRGGRSRHEREQDQQEADC